MAGCEKLTFLLFGLRRQEILKGIIHNAQVRTHEPHTLDGTNADLKVPLGKFDVLSFLEDARPLLAGFLKQPVDPVVGDVWVYGFTEFNCFISFFILLGFLLIPNLGKDKLEYLVEFVFSAVGQDQFFKVLNDFLEIELPP